MSNIETPTKATTAGNDQTDRSPSPPPLSPSSYHLAAARSTVHRDDEMAWQWHIYRLRCVEAKLDSKPPHSFSLIRNEVTAKQLTSKMLREHDVQLANNALVARIKSQKSTYQDFFSGAVNNSPLNSTIHKTKSKQSQPRKVKSSPPVPDDGNKEEEKKEESTESKEETTESKTADAYAAPTSPPAVSSPVGARGLYHNSRADKLRQKKIKKENDNLLRALTRINTRPGPYNADALQTEIANHQALIRQRIPNPMHAHVNVKDGKKTQPPIHFSVIAAQATNTSHHPSSPSKSAHHSPAKTLKSSVSQPVLNTSQQKNRNTSVTPIKSKPSVRPPHTEKPVKHPVVDLDKKENNNNNNKSKEEKTEIASPKSPKSILRSSSTASLPSPSSSPLASTHPPASQASNNNNNEEARTAEQRQDATYTTTVTPSTASTASPPPSSNPLLSTSSSPPSSNPLLTPPPPAQANDPKRSSLDMDIDDLLAGLDDELGGSGASSPTAKPPKKITFADSL